MIKLTLEGAITLYFALVSGLILVSWAFYILRSKSKTRVALQNAKTEKCNFCGAKYMIAPPVKIPRCPTCGSFGDITK